MPDTTGDGERVVLRDGSEVLVRPIEPGDKEGMRRGFEKLSPQSRYRRFMAATPRLTDAQLRYLTEVDHRDHEALVAFTEDREPVGVARYVREAPGSDTAEVAVTVIDEWQGRGVATALLERLARHAEASGIDHLSAYALATNDDVTAVLEDLGELKVVDGDGEVVTMRVDLSPRFGPEDPLRRALRAAASSELRVPFLNGAFQALTEAFGGRARSGRGRAE
jgi:GNAT superfamily N-acetyltransferase